MLFEILTALTEALQPPKSLKDTPNMKISFAQKMKLKKEIYDIYKEYQLFMETSDMPDFNLYFKEQHGLELASTEYIKEQGHNLYISDAIFKEPNKKERLFHEFTHIYDKEYLDKVYAYRKGTKKADRCTHVYTEIHAEQIRFLYMLGCKTVRDIPQNITHNTIIYDLCGKQVPFYDYLKNYKMKMERHYIKDVKKQILKGNILNESAVGDMADKICYYIGALTVYQKYCDYKVDDVMNLSNLSDYWNIDIGKIISFYCTHDLYKPTMQTLDKGEMKDIGDILMYNLIVEARKKFDKN